MSKNIFFISLLAVSIFAGCSGKDNISKPGSTDIDISPIIAFDSMHIKLDSSYIYQAGDSIPTPTSVWRDTGSIKITAVTDNIFNITDSSGYGIQSHNYIVTQAVYMKDEHTYGIAFLPEYQSESSITYSTANPVNQLGLEGSFVMMRLYPNTNTVTPLPFIQGFKKTTDYVYYKIK